MHKSTNQISSSGIATVEDQFKFFSINELALTPHLCNMWNYYELYQQMEKKIIWKFDWKLLHGWEINLSLFLSLIGSVILFN
jgi:hypothetical protein